MNLYDKFRIGSSRKKIDLAKISSDEREHGWNAPGILDEQLAKNTKKLVEFQYKLYAENRQSLLIVLQALDAGGKDGTINNVISVMNPQGCRSQSFKVPTPLEASHDFLWREHCVAPHKGEVVVFNRSHYEDVLAGRIHGDVRGKKLKRHLECINDFEKLLHDNGTMIVKFFLHISKDEQLKRFGERLDDPNKHWKISESDYKEREFWDDYMQAFSDVINHCSTKYAPWFVIPSDNKKFRNFAVSEILVHAMEIMNPQIPPATIDVEKIRKLYHQDFLQAKVGSSSKELKKAEAEKKEEKGKKDRKGGKDKK